MRAYEVLTDGTEGIDLTVRTDGVTGVADVPSAAVLASVTDRLDRQSRVFCQTFVQTFDLLSWICHLCWELCIDRRYHFVGQCLDNVSTVNSIKDVTKVF